MRKRGFTRGFTLAEVMVVLVVIGVLTSILTPVIIKLKPNKNKIMFRKGYYVAERVVSDLVNNETYYADSDSANPHFVDEAKVVINGVDVLGPTKFCNLFASKVNTIGTSDCSTATGYNYPAGAGSFTTTDGILWWIPTDPIAGHTTAFTNPPAAVGNTRAIFIDVNGKADTGVGKNCRFEDGNCPNPDQFIIIVQYDGKLIINGNKESEYLKDSGVQ